MLSACCSTIRWSETVVNSGFSIYPCVFLTNSVRYPLRMIYTSIGTWSFWTTVNVSESTMTTRSSFRRTGTHHWCIVVQPSCSIPWFYLILRFDALIMLPSHGLSRAFSLSTMQAGREGGRTFWENSTRLEIVRTWPPVLLSLLNIQLTNVVDLLFLTSVHCLVFRYLVSIRH